MRIAIVGGATSGLACAYLLQRHHEVTVFEASGTLGGGQQTAWARLDGVEREIDLAPCVFNAASCPQLHALLTELEVPYLPADMSFSVSDPQIDLEYGLGHPGALLARRRNLISPAFWDMLLDIRRFQRESREDCQAGRIDPRLSLRDYLGLCRYSRRFVEHYVVPLSATLCPPGHDDPLAIALLTFLRLSGLHGPLPAPWFRLAAGLQSLLARLPRGSRIRLDSPVLGVARDRFGVTVNSRTDVQRFDKVIFACRGDQALALLERPSVGERLALGAPRYARHEVVLHSDTRLLPRRRRAWASWNYRLGGANGQPAGLTCHLNRLHGIDSSDTLCLSINQTAQIDPQRILARHGMVRPNLHPTPALPDADDLLGANHSYFCGSWLGHGQHEDAVASARRVAVAIAGLTERSRPQRPPGPASISRLPGPDVLYS